MLFLFTVIYMEKKTNLESLIKYNNTDKIDWRKSCENNCVIYFQYGNISDKYYLKEYNRKNKSCIIEYNNKLFSLPTPSILNGRLKNILDIKKDTCVKSKDKKFDRKESKDTYCLYCHTNNKNQKKYFGITCVKPEYRWNHGNGYFNNPRFTNAIKKYGWDEGFAHEVLFTNLSDIQASEMEKYYIEKFNTTDPKFGYNLITGGLTNLSGDHPNFTKVYQYSTDGELIQEWKSIKEAENALGFRSNISRATTTKSHYCGGFLWYKEKPTVFNYQHKPKIYQFDEEGNLIHIYSDITMVDRSVYDLDRIRSCCNHKSHKHKQCIWLYENDAKYIRFYVDQSKFNSPAPAVGQYDKQNNLISYYFSIYSAEDKTGISAQSIYKNCTHQVKTAGNYIWKYETIDKTNPENFIMEGY